MHFGQKAKHVKTTVNINEIGQIPTTLDMEKATKLIAELKHKIKEYEMKFTEPSPLRLLTTELDVDMVQDTKISEISSQAMRD